jgi:hypothetical protein
MVVVKMVRRFESKSMDIYIHHKRTMCRTTWCCQYGPMFGLLQFIHRALRLTAIHHLTWSPVRQAARIFGQCSGQSHRTPPWYDSNS